MKGSDNNEEEEEVPNVLLPLMHSNSSLNATFVASRSMVLK